MRFNEKELVFLSRQPSERAAELGMKGPKKGDGKITGAHANPLYLICLQSSCTVHLLSLWRLFVFLPLFLPHSHEEETGQAYSQFPVLLSHLWGGGDNLNFLCYFLLCLNLWFAREIDIILRIVYLYSQLGLCFWSSVESREKMISPSPSVSEMFCIIIFFFFFFYNNNG